jgi:hypothetical protein
MWNHCTTVVGAAVFVMAASAFAIAQAPSGSGVFGFYDPASGAFRPATVQPQAAATGPAVDSPQALVSRSGKVHFKINIKVLSGSPSTTVPSCFLSFSHSGVGINYNESVSFAGTRTNNAAQCNITIPYKWVSANNANPITASMSLSVGGRGHSETILPVPLPGNGNTALFDLDVTM